MSFSSACVISRRWARRNERRAYLLLFFGCDAQLHESGTFVRLTEEGTGLFT